MWSRDRDVAVSRAGSDLSSPGYQVGGSIFMRYAAPRPGLLVSFVVEARIVGNAIRPQSQRSIWPLSAAVRHASIAPMMLRAVRPR